MDIFGYLIYLFMVTCGCTTAKKNVLNNVHARSQNVNTVFFVLFFFCLLLFFGLIETECAITEERAQH